MSDSNNIVLTAKELEDLAEKVADKVMEDTLNKLGIDPADFKETQKDMIYLRRTRRLREAVEEKKIFLIVGILFTVAMSLIGAGVIAWIKTTIGSTP